MILVTGGAGYVGSVLVPLLVSLGYKIRVFDNFLFGNKSLQQIDYKIEKIKGDVRKIQLSALKEIDSIIHLAALSNDPMADFAPEENFSINKEGTRRLVKLAKKAGVKRFIFASSCSIYNMDNSQKCIFSCEETRVGPTANYSLSKYEAERIVLSATDNRFCPVVLRKGTIYGYSPRLRYDLVVNTMVKDILNEKKIHVFGHGREWRPLVEINDVARAYLLALEAPINKVKGQIFNIAYDNFRIIDLANQIKDCCQNKFKVKIIDSVCDKKLRNYKVTTKKAKEILGFSPKISVVKSVKTMIDKIINNNLTDFTNPIYYNIAWLKNKLAKIS